MQAPCARREMGGGGLSVGPTRSILTPPAPPKKKPNNKTETWNHAADRTEAPQAGRGSAWGCRTRASTAAAEIQATQLVVLP